VKGNNMVSVACQHHRATEIHEVM